jgi:hypothetical protein
MPMRIEDPLSTIECHLTSHCFADLVAKLWQHCLKQLRYPFPERVSFSRVWVACKSLRNAAS